MIDRDELLVIHAKCNHASFKKKKSVIMHNTIPKSKFGEVQAFILVGKTKHGRTIYVYSNCDAKTGNGIGVWIDNLWVLCINKFKKVSTKDIRVIYIILCNTRFGYLMGVGMKTKEAKSLQFII